MQTNKTLIFDKNADAIFKKGDYTSSYMVINLKNVNLDFYIEEENTKLYNFIAVLTDEDNNPIPNNIIEFYRTIDDDNCVIDIESDKEFVRNNKICILTATVTQDDIPLENILVQFYSDNILIGESITNKNGQALFEYVGYGTDSTVITAKCDDIISNDININNYIGNTETIQLSHTDNIVQINDTTTLTAYVLDEYQQPYDNVNISFVQKNKKLYSTTEDENTETLSNNWINVVQAANTITIDSTGILIETNADQYTSTYMQLVPSIFQYAQNIDEGFIIEYELISNTKMYPTLALKKTDGTSSYPGFDITGNIRLEIDKNGYKCYVNNILDTSKSAEMDIATIRFYLQSRRSNGNSNIKFKNLKIFTNKTVHTTNTNIDGSALYELLGDNSGINNYVAKIDNTESELIEIINAIAKYKGTSYGSSSLVQETTDGITTLSTQNNNYGLFYFSKSIYASGSYYITKGQAFALTAINYDGTVTIRMDTSDGNNKTLINSINNPTFFRDNNHIRLVHQGTYAEIFINKQSVKTVNLTDARRLTIRLEDGAMFVFKDLCVFNLYESRSTNALEITSNKNILSAYDSDVATITATYTEDGVGIDGKTVTFKQNDSILSTEITNNHGIATYDYIANGNGDTTITIECDNLTKTYNIEDLLYYNDGTKTTGITIPTGAIVTTEDGALKITCTTSREKKISYPLPLTSAINFIAEFEIAKIGVYQSIALYLKDSTTANGCWFSYRDDGNRWDGGVGTTWSISNANLSVGDIIKIKQENGTITMYQNDTQLYTTSKVLSGTYYIGNYTNNNRTQYVKNIKIKPL